MRSFVAVFVLVAAIAVPAAAGDGGPTPGVSQGWQGIAAPDGKLRYVALPARGTTVIAAVRIEGGVVTRFGVVPGSVGVPYVTWNGTPGGLSFDGRTLVLAPAGVAFRKVTRFEVFDSKRFRVKQTVTVRGMFSFDALSPDARTLFLTEHLSPRDSTYYRIRAYDLSSNRLLAKPIVDRTEPGEEMRGQAIARLTGPGGRWVYTLYGGGEHPFVHALDTVARTARCLDFHWTGGNDALWGLRLSLSPDGRQLLLLRRDSSRAVTIEAPKA